MPWNCLCAAKEKRKLEISAPILNIEDTHNNQLQLIPLKKQQHQQQLQTVSYKFNEKNNKKLARHHSIETKATSASADSTDTLDISSSVAGAATATGTADISQIGFSNSRLNGEITKDPQQQNLQDSCNNNDGPIRKTSKWKRNKKNQQNNNKLTNNNNSSNQKTAKTSSKKNASNDNNLQGTPDTVLLTKNNNEENGRITKQLTNVKFSFDTKSKKDKLTKDTIAVATAHVLQQTQTTENDKKNVQQLKCNGTSSGCNSKILPVQLNATPLSTTIEEKDAVQENYEKNVEIVVKNNSQNDNSDDMNKINENVNITDVEQLKNENTTGNYDEIPLIRVEKTTTAEGSSKIICSSSSSTTIGQVVEYQRTDANVVPNDIFFPPPPPPQTNTTTSVSAFPLDKSSESIPFIDDEDPRKHHHHQHHQQHNTIDSMTQKQQHSSQQLRSEDDHSARFITLHPKNVVSYNTYAKQLQDEQAAKYLEELATRQHGKNTGNPMIGRGESFSPPPLQYAESAVEHNFQVWKAAKGKLCQVCHGSLIVKPNSVVKCFNCDLICHNWCASSMPTIRYHDTSFVIFRKWLKAQDELAFPSVHQYIKNEGLKNSSDASTAAVTTTASSLKTFGDHYLTDSECTYSNGKPFENQSNGIKQKRRRTKSLEKCEKLDNDDNDGDEIALIIEETVPDYTEIQKVEEKNPQDDQNNNDLTGETTKLQIIESNSDTNEKDETKKDKQEDKIQKQEDNDSVSIETKENTVTVDIHNSNKSPIDQVDNSNTSELLVITENEYETIKKKNTKDKPIPDDVPEVQKRDKDEGMTTTTTTTTAAEKQMFRISDSSDKTLTSEIRSTTNLASSSEPPLIDYKIKAQSEPSRRKNYNRTVCYSPISTTSSSSMSLHTDDPDESIVEYATVDLRRPGNIYPASEDQLFSKTNDDRRPETIPKSQSFPIQTKQHYYYHRPHQHHNHHNQIADSLRLHYVTQRILASVLPRRDPNDIGDDDDADPSVAAAPIIINRPHSEGRVTPSHHYHHHGIEDKYEKEVISMLEQKHGKNYKVLDLESCISVVTLERLCELCKLIDQWLGSGQEKVIVLQDREDRQRLGAAIAAYLEYLDICASNFTIRRNGKISLNTTEDLRAQSTIARNWLDLDIFSMKKFLEDFIGPLRIPSYKRYLQLFSGLLSGKIRMNSSPVHLEFISVESPPSWLQYDRFTTTTSATSLSSQTEWNSFIKIYEGLQCIYTSDIHIIPITTRQFLYQIGNLRLRGDILIRCYQIVTNDNNLNSKTATRELLFSVQFHTCAINSKDVTFIKDDLDFACDDPRFPKDNKITLHLSNLSTNENNYVFQSPLIRTEPPNAIAKADSVETFDIGSSYHTQGPIDGSLYATILKSPKHHPSHLQLNRSQSVQETLSHQNNVISPPPQFSNKQQQQQQYEIVERRPISSTPIRSNSIENSTLRRETSVATTTTTSTSNISDTLRGQSQPRSDYSYVESRPGTLQSTYQEKTGNYSSGSQHHQHLRTTTPITIVETYTTIDSGGNTQTYHQNGRQSSVRSPLTLSMDSGISSSGLLNRPPQGSSVSPSSFPSQASPQEDRHRELDDILSDMLMTVQDIPDFNKSYKQQHQQHHTIQKIIRSQSVIPTTSGSYGLPLSAAGATSHHHHHHHHNHNQHHPQYSQDTVKRSQSYSATPQIKDRSVDFYDTSSTTTTLTPPPSESGRDTPIIASVSGVGSVGNNNSISNISTLQRRQTLQQQREKREIYTTTTTSSSSSNLATQIVGGATSQQQTIGDQHQQHQQRAIIMDLQQHQHHQNHQSSVYPQTVQTINKSEIVSEDNGNIPYHAREDSQPFTYGNVPNGQIQLSSTATVTTNSASLQQEQDPRMIKTQSGLSSPSLVRKTLGSTSTLRKPTPPRNDFEEMLRERREKVMSEKYSISDKPQSNVDFDKNFDRSWTNNGSATLRQTNGYHYYNEPLKRSNTLDGFHRSTSTDGISGQTWLQLQQQKLRAKKDQQMREDRKYFEEQIHTEIRNRPLRSRPNIQRFDGYASDTAAFADEVDYRRPLHVQTPYRSPDRYHTMTTTTKTMVQHPERPFATVKRNEYVAKRDAYGSPPPPLQPLQPQISPISVMNASLSPPPSSNGHLSSQTQVFINQNSTTTQNNNNNNSNNINQAQNGLLSMADSPTRNGHVRLESELMLNFEDDNNSLACTNVNYNSHIIDNISNSSNNSNNNSKNNNNNNNLTIINGTIDHAHHHNNSISNNNNNNNNNNIIINNCNKNNNNNNVNDIHHSPQSQPPPQISQSPHHNGKNENSPSQLNNNNKNNNKNHHNHHHHHHHHHDYRMHNNSASIINDPDELNNLASIAACGQLALDRLLASLAIETDLMDKQLNSVISTGTQINNNNHHNNNNNMNLNHDHIDNVVKKNEFIDEINEIMITQNDRYNKISLKNSQDHDNKFYNNRQINSGQLSLSKINTDTIANQELTDVIADLTEYTRYENMRHHHQMNTNCNNNNNNNNGNNNNNHINSNTYFDNVSNNSNSNSNSSSSNGILRRLASESENSSSISPSLSERSNAILWPEQVREESFSSYRSETDPELSIAGSPRPETPAFPVTPRTPYGLNSNGSVSPALPPKSPTSQRKDLYTGTQKGQLHEVVNQNETISCYASRRNSNSSNTNSEPQEVAPHHVKFVQDSSKYWYKPNLSREEAVNLLRNAVPGTFIVRDSTTFRNAFGLVVRVAHPPPGVIAKGNSDELVRHFLVEPTSRGVRLKGCANEPVFTSLSALVYQHSITPLALPCRLIIPDRDIQTSNYQSPAQKQLLTQGAACNVLYLFVCDTESLTGEEAVRRAVHQLFGTKPLPKPTEVHFKVSQQGITLTDNTRQKFFRKHYSANMVSFCGFDPDRHMWSVKATDGEIPVDKKTIFAFVARRSASSTDNQCHVFCDLQPNQPAAAIVSFVNKVLPTEKIINQNI